MRSLWETVLSPKTPIKSVISHLLTLTSSGASSLTSLNMSLTSLLSSFSVMCPSPLTSNTRKIRVNASSAVPSDMMWKTNWKVFMKTKLIKDSARLPWTRQSQCSRSRSRRNIWKCASACALRPVLAGPAWRTIRIQMFAKIFTFSKPSNNLSAYKSKYKRNCNYLREYNAFCKVCNVQKWKLTLFVLGNSRKIKNHSWNVFLNE